MKNEKIPFDSIKSNVNEITRTVKINDKEIQVKQYLPINQKLELVTNVLKQVAGNAYNFVNPIQLDVYTTIEILKYYTNIEFTEDATPAEIYDALEIDSLANKIIALIPEYEYNFIQDGVQNTVTAYYNYQNSVLGILETISQDYSNLNLEAMDIQSKIGDPKNLTLLKDIVEKIG